ncbi:membrane protein [Vibrio parahaemolyticus]|nr:membrane protein [Vibrio parahaemolyticus]
MFTAFALRFLLWLFIHRLLRERIDSGEIWHRLLLELSILALCVCLGLLLLVAW